MIFLLLLSLILYFNLNKLFSLRTDQLVNQLQDQENAFYYPAKHPEFTTVSKNWGGYQVSTNKANLDQRETKNNQLNISKSALTSYKWMHLGLPQLYLENDNSSLQISGQTYLEGAVHVPKGKVLTTSVSSRIYEGPELSGLEVNSSLNKLPAHPLENLSFIEAQDFSQDSIIQFKPDINYSNSFNKNGASIVSDITIHLYENNINGNVRILSKSKIVIHQNAVLKDILLIAPVIVFKENFKGTVHAIARDSIIVSKNVKLSFPSSITLTNDSGSSPLIKIEEKASIEGNINQFYYQEEKTNFSQLFIATDATIKGVVYNRCNTTLKGTVDGSLFTKSLLVYENGRIYRNFIIDGKLIKTNWLDFISKNNDAQNIDSQPIKWLY
ncbi:hypothetical protein [Nonlabens ulvanivorans]|uniref:hypothetical protein n=1 Tax=Nonlabens ulvanivorans TaxID=906888 RepID=UPI0037C6E6B4